MLALRNTVTPQRTMSEQRDSSTVHPSQAKTTVNIATLRTAASGGDAAAAAAQDTSASTRGLEESRQLKAALNSMGLSTKGALLLSLSLSFSLSLSLPALSPPSCLSSQLSQLSIAAVGYDCRH